MLTPEEVGQAFAEEIRDELGMPKFRSPTVDLQMMRIVLAIEENLCNKKGFNLRTLDAEDRREIRQGWKKIIGNGLAAVAIPKWPEASTQRLADLLFGVIGGECTNLSAKATGATWAEIRSK